MDKKIVHPQYRDPIREYTGKLLKELVAEAGKRCSHPSCDSQYLSLNAHHIIYHARGGPTNRLNGLLLCKRCHKLLHDGLIPQRLVYIIKNWILSSRTAPLPISNISAEELESKSDSIANDKSLTVNEKFSELNDILIAANFLPSKSSMFFVFVNTIAAKVRILNDGTYTLRSSLDNMLISMDHRRKWAQILAANAFRYAEEIKYQWQSLYLLHSRAVGFNARNKFSYAVNEFKNALAYLENMRVSNDKKNEAKQVKTRLLREMAVCRAKEKHRSTKAKNEFQLSFDMAHSIGELHNIDDALVRCVEGSIYLGELSSAETYLDKLYLNWPRMDNHLKAITMKMDAKLSIAQNRMDNAENLIEKGLNWSSDHGFYHQMYHFKRLEWQMKLEFKDNRQRIIT
ncbi:HNH endonuclease [Candidatus Woesearchaeota archaeon]|nr:HNH endonuclease [Candidatus Woesearchaeota archaeon]